MPTNRLTRRLTYGFRSQSADQIYSWMSRHLPDGPRPPVVRPVNYVMIISVITILLGLATFFTVASPYILPVIQNRNLWAAVSLITILLFTSGQMFNHIRRVPYVSGNGQGGIQYFAGGFSNQFGIETQIVAAMCKCCAARCKCRLLANSRILQMACWPLQLSRWP